MRTLVKYMLIFFGTGDAWVMSLTNETIVFISLMTSNLACRFMSPCSMMMWSLITVWKRWGLNHREDMIFTIPQLWLYTLVRLYNVKISMLKGWYFNMSWATYWITFKSESQISATYGHKCYTTVWAKAVNKIFFPLNPPPRLHYFLMNT